MSQLDAIIERSRAPGAFVERKRFSLSRDKAIEKLREFSLRNPRQYVLELIQAAVFSGATYIAVDVESDRCLVAWVGGRPFVESQLGSVFDYLFLDRGDLENRHLVQLAVGLNAVLQRAPKVLRVESGDGSPSRTVRMDLDARGKGVVGKPEQALAGTYIVAEFRGGWLSRFTDDGSTEEERLIEERCRFSPVPILLNGRAPFGYKASRRLSLPGCPHFTPFDDGERYGVVGVPPRGTHGQGFSLVIGGVWVTSLELPELGLLPISARAGRTEPTGLVGVIGDDRLRKTADHSDIVREGRFTEMLHAVQPHATQLIRAVTKRAYEAPPLPKIVGGVTVNEPLPDEITQLEPREDLTLDHIRALPPGAPVFRVRPEDVESMQIAADLARFPYPVLVLKDSQVATLETEAPEVTVSRLSSPADIEFVRRMMERRQRTREVSVPFQSSVIAAQTGTLHLSLHLEGAAPLWGDPERGDVPLMATIAGRTRWCSRTSLGMPGVSAVLELDPGVDLLPGEGPTEVEEAVIDGAWRLLPTGGASLHAGERRLLCALLAAHAIPHFVDQDDATLLDVSLPAQWSAPGLRRQPLVETADGPLDFDGFLALQGTDRVIALARGEDLDSMKALEERFGFGHLAEPVMAGAPIALVGWVKDGWHWLGRDRVSRAEVQRLMWVGPVFAPQTDDERWSQVEFEVPCVGAAVRRGEKPPAREEWLEAETLLYRNLRMVVVGDEWDHLTQVDLAPSRVQAMARLAVLHLGRHLGRLDLDALLRSPDGTAFRTIGELRSMPQFRIAPRHGPTCLEPATLLMDLDELRAVERDPRVGRLPLRFDDPPQLWDSLADAGDPGWLVRQEVDVPGLRGWLGLRDPYDDTTGVFLQSAGVRIALSDVDADVPCHGLVRLFGGGTEINEAQSALLSLARQQLYQQIVVGLQEARFEGTAADAARRYGMVYVRDAWMDRGELKGIAGELARLIQVPGADGRNWGSIGQWMSTDVRQRPPLPANLQSGAYPVVDDEDIGNIAADSLIAEAGGWSSARNEVLEQLEQRLVSASVGALDRTVPSVFLAEEGPKAPLIRFEDRWTILVFELNSSHPLAQDALAGGRRAREMILLEMARMIGSWARKRRRPFDLLEAQRLIVAQRLGRHG